MPGGNQYGVPALASDLLIVRLTSWGVDTIFGRPDNSLADAVRRAESRVRLLPVHHDEAAAQMAVGHAMASGRIGVCLAGGAGVERLAHGLRDAQYDRVPVLAVTVEPPQDSTASAVDRVSRYSRVVSNPVQLPALVDVAVRMAYARAAVAHLQMHPDILVAAVDVTRWEHVTPVPLPNEPGYLAPALRPDQHELATAAALLNDAERPAILVVARTTGAARLLQAVADTLGAPILKTPPGKMAVPDDSPLCAAGLGPAGTDPGDELITDVDTLLVVGSGHGDRIHLLDLPGIRKVRLGTGLAAGGRPGGIDPAELTLAGHLIPALESLLPMLRRRADRTHLYRHQERTMRQHRDIAARLRGPADRTTPSYLAHLLNRLAASDAIMTCDRGPAGKAAARRWRVHGGREFYLAGGPGSGGSALPHASAVQLAQPHRQVVAFGARAALTAVFAEFDTAARHGLPVKIVVVGDRRDRGPNLAAWARACGGHGEHLHDATRLPAAMRAALAHDGPALLDVDADLTDGLP